MANSKKRCRNCKKYRPSNDMLHLNGGNYCDIECATSYGFKNKEKGKKIKYNQEKKNFRLSDKKIRKEAAIRACNSYIRERDKGLPCISCKNTPNYSGHIGGSGIQAGHYKSRGAKPELMFEELNIHVQCYRCNVQLSGNIENYRINLIKKIGLSKVEWLEGYHKPKNYTAEDYKKIEDYYKQKLKDLIQ